ncbi:MAG: hypothetical protein JO257_28745 [Deltaproteobacteria bacterium]|nr:hypothetical protein [Deltaproteobacteria bacterium]
MKLPAVALALVATAASAHADSKAWATAKTKLPGGLVAVFGINMGSIKSSELYKQMVPMLEAKAGKAKDNLDKIKTTCGIDLTGSIDSVVVGFGESTDKKDNSGVIIVALKGTTQKDLEACSQKVAKAEGKTLTITKDGAITKYSGMGDDDAYVRWFSKDTLAIGDSKDDVTKLTAGGIGKDVLATDAGKVNTNAAVWVAVNKTQDLDDLKGKMTGGFGTLDLKAGNLVVDAHIIMDSPKTAAEGVKQGTAQLDQIKKSGQIPKQFTPMLDSIKLSANGAELLAGATVAEKDLASLIQMAAAMAGH